MLHAKTYVVFLLLGLLALGVLLFAAVGCSSEPRSAATTRPAGSVAAKGGAQLWAQECGRCHNLHSPSHYNAVQWEVTVHAMRIRADLTGEEQRTITEFLQSASR